MDHRADCDGSGRQDPYGHWSRDQRGYRGVPCGLAELRSKERLVVDRPVLPRPPDGTVAGGGGGVGRGESKARAVDRGSRASSWSWARGDE